jgi:hypothetical protein
MGLPDPDSAKAWGGKLLVDREGTAIGTCTEIFVDDATGLPEWASADLSGGPAFIPLMDAAESGDQVRVAVRQADVADAPPVAEPGHISTDEEERLYRHYGIEFSQDASETVLPVDEPLAPPEPSSSTLSTLPATEVTEVPDENRRPLLPALAGGTVGVLAALAAAVFWWRQRQQVPPTRKELLAARTHAAALALAARREQVAVSAAPLLRSGRQFSAVAAQQAAVRARATAAWAAVQARAAAQQAAAAAAAGTAELQRISRRPAPEPVVVATTGGGHDRAVGALGAGAGFVAGYVLRARAGGARFEQLKQVPTTWTQRPQLQQTAGRVQARVTDALQAGNAQLSRRAGAVSDRVRRRSSSPEEAPAGSDDSGSPSGTSA